MSIKILTKSGEEITAVDDARAYNFDAGNKSGIVKGALNEGRLFLVSSNVIGLDSCELRISGHRIVIDSAESITMANRPSVATRYSMIAEVVVSDASVPSFRLFIQPAKTELIQQNLYKTLNGNGTYQLRIGNFTLGTDGLISDVVRTADVISGAINGVGDIEFNVTTETIAGDLEPEVNVDFNEETKKYDMHFALPLSSGTSVIENGEVVKRFNADLKVDKEEGKGLSTNDFTTAEKNKLAGLSNYNDTEIKNSIQTLQKNKQDKLTAGNGINIENGMISSKGFEFVGNYSSTTSMLSIGIDLDNYNYLAFVAHGRGQESNLGVFFNQGLTWTTKTPTGTLSQSHTYSTWAYSFSSVLFIRYDGSKTYVLTGDLTFSYATGKPANLTVWGDVGNAEQSYITLYRSKKL